MLRTSRLQHCIGACLLLFVCISNVFAQSSEESVTGFWNTNLHQMNIAECSALSAVSAVLTLTLKNSSGATIATQQHTLSAWGTIHVVLNSFGGQNLADQYGTYVAEADSPIYCHTAVYRLNSPGANKPVEYAYSMPTAKKLNGISVGIFNSSNAESGPLPVLNWLSFVNFENTSSRASIELYNLGGELISQIDSGPLAPGQRVDLPIGHPQGQTLGMFRIVPSSPQHRYAAFVIRYGQRSDGFNFAFPIQALQPTCDPGSIPASTMDPALNYGEVANINSGNRQFQIEVRNQTGQLVHEEDFELSGFAQRHFPLHQWLGPSNVGSFRVRCVGPQNGGVYVQSLYYGQLSAQSPIIEWAYASQATGRVIQNGQIIASALNTYLGALNWNKYHEQAGASSPLNFDIRDEGGQLIANDQRLLQGNGSVDYPFHVQLPADRVGLGLVRLEDSTARMNAELLRVFYRTDGRIGYIMNLPGTVLAQNGGSSSSSSTSSTSSGQTSSSGSLSSASSSSRRSSSSFSFSSWSPSSSSLSVSSSSSSVTIGDLSCNPASVIQDTFTSGNPALLGTATDLQQDGNQGLRPLRSVTAAPLIESSTLVQLNFENAARPGENSSTDGAPFTCTNCPTRVAGRIGYAASFDGNDTFVSEQLRGFRFNNTDFTWALWFRSSNSATQYFLGSYCGLGHITANLRMANGQISAAVDPESGSGTTVTSIRTGLADGQWHYVAFTRASTSGLLSLYIDGVLDRQLTGAVDGGILTCGRVAIGSSNLASSALNGMRGELDAVTLYRRALTADEIAQHYTRNRLQGEFVSRQITLARPIFALSGSIDETSSEHSRLEVSFNGSTWCPLAGTLNDPRCPFPSSNVRYRLLVEDETRVRSVQLLANCTSRCVDYDNDGSTTNPSLVSLCPRQQLDCDDQNPYIGPHVANAYCSCGGTPATQDICSDSTDNDCDGAIDEDDNDCYSAGVIRYFSTSKGWDGNDGQSPQTPMASLDLAQSMLSLRVEPGDKILLRRGDTWRGESLDVRNQGTANLPIIIGTYGDGDRARLHAMEETSLISFRDARYVTVSGLHLTRQSESIYVTGFAFDPQVSSDRVTIEDVHIDGLGYGLAVKATNFLLRDSIINNNNNLVAGGGHSQGLWVFSGSDYGVVQNSIFYNNGKPDIIFDHNVYLGGGNYWLFEGNSFSGESGTSIVFHGVQRGHVIRNNLFFNNTNNHAMDISDYSSGQLLQDFVVENNRVFDNPAGGFWIRGAVNLTVRNNIFYNNGTVFQIGPGVDHPTTGMVVEHNTFFDNNGLLSADANAEVAFRFNLWDSGSTSGGIVTRLENFTAVPSRDFVNPAAGNFHLRAGSPAIDTALSSTLNFDAEENFRPRDGNGDGIPVADAGAYEH